MDHGKLVLDDEKHFVSISSATDRASIATVERVRVTHLASEFGFESTPLLVVGDWAPWLKPTDFVHRATSVQLYVVGPTRSHKFDRIHQTPERQSEIQRKLDLKVSVQTARDFRRRRGDSVEPRP
jgi:hypothetical protein